MQFKCKIIINGVKLYPYKHFSKREGQQFPVCISNSKENSSSWSRQLDGNLSIDNKRDVFGENKSTRNCTTEYNIFNYDLTVAGKVVKATDKCSKHECMLRLDRNLDTRHIISSWWGALFFFPSLMVFATLPLKEMDGAFVSPQSKMCISTSFSECYEIYSIFFVRHFTAFCEEKGWFNLRSAKVSCLKHCQVKFRLILRIWSKIIDSLVKKIRSLQHLLKFSDHTFSKC